MGRQRLADLGSREVDVGVGLAQAGRERTIPYHHRAQLGAPLAHGLDGAHEQVKVLLRRQPPDIQRHRGIRPGAPALAQRGIAPGGVEQLGVDPAPQHPQPFEALRRTLLALVLGRDQGEGGGIVEMAQVGQHRAAQPGQAVMAGIDMEMGVQAGRDRDAEGACRAQRGVAERALGVDVHHIRAQAGPPGTQAVTGRQTELHGGIAGHRHAADAQLSLLKRRGWPPGLGTHKVHAMAQPTQLAHHGHERAGDTVQFGGIGFGDQRDAHRAHPWAATGASKDAMRR